MKTLNFLVFLALLLVFSAGCQTTSQGSRTYTRGQAQTKLSVYSGTVLNVADVRIQTEETGAGAVVGGVAGGVAGSTVGSGGGRKLATVGGAILGGVAGSQVEKGIGNRPGIEIEVELDNGRIIVVVQEPDDTFVVGDRVRVIEAPDGNIRVRQ
jgi:outer membrane lipoprotein SlyB